MDKLKRLQERIVPLERIRDNFKYMKKTSAAESRLAENAYRGIRGLNCPKDSRAISEQLILYASNRVFFKMEDRLEAPYRVTSREDYENTLKYFISEHRNLARDGKGAENFQFRYCGDAETHNEIADYYIEQLKESLATPYADREPRDFSEEML